MVPCAERHKPFLPAVPTISALKCVDLAAPVMWNVRSQPSTTVKIPKSSFLVLMKTCEFLSPFTIVFFLPVSKEFHIEV